MFQISICIYSVLHRREKKILSLAHEKFCDIIWYSMIWLDKTHMMIANLWFEVIDYTHLIKSYILVQLIQSQLCNLLGRWIKLFKLVCRIDWRKWMELTWLETWMPLQFCYMSIIAFPIISNEKSKFRIIAPLWRNSTGAESTSMSRRHHVMISDIL